MEVVSHKSDVLLEVVSDITTASAASNVTKVHSWYIVQDC